MPVYLNMAQLQGINFLSRFQHIGIIYVDWLGIKLTTALQHTIIWQTVALLHGHSRGWEWEILL